MLTSRQQQVLDFLRDHLRAHGVMPSTREIQEAFGFASQTGAMNHLRALERKGALKRDARKARAMQIPGDRSIDEVVAIPVYGRIAAGMAEAVEQETDESLLVDRGMFAGAVKDTFALRVRGESMSGAHITDGDTVILERREPRHGDIVAALIDGETTLKRYTVRKGKPYLTAENPAYPDLLPARELYVQGVMVGLMRTLRTA